MLTSIANKVFIIITIIIIKVVIIHHHHQVNLQGSKSSLLSQYVSKLLLWITHYHFCTNLNSIESFYSVTLFQAFSLSPMQLLQYNAQLMQTNTTQHKNTSNLY